MAEKIIRMGLSLLVSIYVVRYLGPERFGVLSYVLSFVGLFAAISGLGLDGVVVRNLVEKPGKRDVILGTSFILKILGTLLMWLSILLVIPFVNNDYITNILIAVIAFAAIFQSLNVIDFYNQAAIQARSTVLPKMFSMIVTVSLQVYFVLVGAPLIWFAWVYFIEALVLTLGLIVFFWKNGGKLWRWTWQWQMARNILKDSWPLLLSGMVISIYMKIDQVMIREMLGEEEVGLYAAAVQLSEAWYFIPMAITTSVFPAIVNAKKQSKKLYQWRLQKLYHLMVTIAVAIALPTTFLATWLVKLLYGEVYVDAADVLSVHIWAGIFVFLGVASGRYLVAENFTKIAFFRNLLGMFINVILNYYLIRDFGIVGAAIATLICVFVSFYLAHAIFPLTRSLFREQTRSLLFFLNEDD